MSKVTSPSEVYELHVWLREISPMILRRLLVRSDSTIADLHYTLYASPFAPSISHCLNFKLRVKSSPQPQPL